MRRRGERGNILVEFALTTSIFALLFLGTFQFGYAMYSYNSLVNGIRAGARYASIAKISNSGNATLNSAYITAVRNVVVFGTPAPGDNATPIVTGLSPSQVSVTATWDIENVPKSVTVRVSSLTIDAVLTTFTITNKPSLQMPFLGQYCSTSC